MSANTDNLIEFAKAWASLGDGITEQILDVWHIGPRADANPAAVERAIAMLPAAPGSRELTDQLRAWLGANR